jgi:hypothetical protein
MFAMLLLHVPYLWCAYVRRIVCGVAAFVVFVAYAGGFIVLCCLKFSAYGWLCICICGAAAVTVTVRPLVCWCRMKFMQRALEKQRQQAQREIEEVKRQLEEEVSVKPMFMFWVESMHRSTPFV